MWQLAINAGLRHGEISALSWSDVNFENGTLHIRRNLTRLGDFVPPKTAAGDRIITLLSPALDALRAQYVITGRLPAIDITQNFREHGKTEVQKHRFIFVSGLSKNKPGVYFSPQSITDRWDAAIKKSGTRRRTPYQSRHTFACWALSAGANPSFIASQLGHEDAEMVFRVYSSWIKEFDGEQVSMLNQKLGIVPIVSQTETKKVK